MVSHIYSEVYEVVLDCVGGDFNEEFEEVFFRGGVDVFHAVFSFLKSF